MYIIIFTDFNLNSRKKKKGKAVKKFLGPNDDDLSLLLVLFYSKPKNQYK